MRGARPASCTLLALCCVAPATPGLAAEELRNWFNDPFFQVRAAIAGCPAPAGPFTDRKGFLAQSHRRAEKGTTAWLAGEAQRPKAYAYDEEIASALKAAFRDATDFGQSTLWVTVQGRVVYVEGCLPAGARPADLEAFVRRTANVQQAIAAVRLGPAGRVPYALMPPPAAAPGTAK